MITVHHPPTATRIAGTLGRGLGPLAAALRARGSQAGKALWSALEAYGNSRARREFLSLADRYASTQPDLAKQMRTAYRELGQPPSPHTSPPTSPTTSPSTSPAQGTKP